MLPSSDKVHAASGPRQHLKQVAQGTFVLSVCFSWVFAGLQLLASNILNPRNIEVSLDDIGGLEDVKADMVRWGKRGLLTEHKSGRLTVESCNSTVVGLRGGGCWFAFQGLRYITSTGRYHQHHQS